MIRKDGLWWVGALVVPILIALGIVVSILYINTNPGPTEIFGFSIPLSVSFLPAFYSLVYVGIIIKVATWVPSARRRQRLRARALAGDLDVMPPADIAVDASGAPDVSREPLVLQWRVGWRFRQFVWIFLVMLVLDVALTGYMILAIMVLPRSNPLLDTGSWTAASVISATAFSGVWIVIRRRARRSPSALAGIVASDEGLRQLKGRHAGTIVRWQDARLLEVERRYGQSSTRVYALLGRNGLVTWNSAVTSTAGLLPTGMSAEEWARRERALLDLIAARTGLTPRTFEPALSRAPAELPPIHQGLWLFRLVLLSLYGASVAVATIYLARGMLAAPLPFSSLLLDYLAGSIAFAGLSLLLVVLLGLISVVRIKSRPLSAPHLPAPPPMSQGQSVTLAYRWTNRERLTAGFYGLILTSWLALVGFAYLVPGAPSGPRSVVPSEETIIVAIIGFIGFLALLFAIFDRPINTIRANASILQVVAPRAQQRLIPWDEVSKVTYVVSANGDRFVVSRKADGGEIRWPVRALRLVPPPAGQQAITPEQLAALVVQRSGVQLTVRREE